MELCRDPKGVNLLKEEQSSHVQYLVVAIICWSIFLFVKVHQGRQLLTSIDCYCR
jgi:hypothetical protein